MIFSELYKSSRSPITKFRPSSVHLTTSLSGDGPDWLAEEHADLLSKDKAKQKEAVKHYLETKVRNDWEFTWPSRVPVPVPVPVLQTVLQPVANGTEEDSPSAPPAAQSATSTTPDMTVPVEPVQDKTRDDAGYQVDDDSESENESDAESTYSTVSEDLLRYRPRLEWTSDFSDGEGDDGRSPYRFDNPGAVGTNVQAAALVKRARRRRAVRKEMEWNEGLACFEARRDAWTNARTVRVRTKPTSPPPVSPRSARRLFFRRSMSSSPPSSNISSHLATTSDGSDGSSLTKDEKELRKSQSSTPGTPLQSQNYPVETLVPLGPPLLPPNNPLRASITPGVYISLYEKVIIHGLQPSCPINLSDMLRACVAGWKRDGEWPPRPAPAPPSVARKKKKAAAAAAAAADHNSGNIARRMSFGLLGRDKEEDASNSTAKGIRRSLQRALGIGATTTPSTTHAGA